MISSMCKGVVASKREVSDPDVTEVRGRDGFLLAVADSYAATWKIRGNMLLSTDYGQVHPVIKRWIIEDTARLLELARVAAIPGTTLLDAPVNLASGV